MPVELLEKFPGLRRDWGLFNYLLMSPKKATALGMGAMIRLIALLICLTVFSSSAATEMFRRGMDPTARVENFGTELVLRYSLTEISARPAVGIILANSEIRSELVILPRGQGIFLKEDQTMGKHGYIIYIIFHQECPNPEDLVAVFGDTVYWDIGGRQMPGSERRGWLALSINSDQEAERVLREARRFFQVDPLRVFDLRLSAEEMDRPVKMTGKLTEEDIEEIRLTVFAMARRQILGKLATLAPEFWSEPLAEWPGRHGLEIRAPDKYRAAAEYAPNRGYQMEKIDGQWTIVGG